MMTEWRCLPQAMFDGRLIQQLDPMTVPSKRRNPLLADFFHRLKLMERRGSGMKKIIGEYKLFENLKNYHAPEFSSNASEFHVTMWNLNYAMDVIKDNPHVVKAPEDVVKDVVKETGDVVKAKANVTKEFVKAQRKIYKLISKHLKINATQMFENMGISLRQVQRYLKQLSNLKLIVREGGAKMVFGKYRMKNMKVSSKESEEYQQIGLGSFHMRNYPAPYRIVFVVNVLNSNTF